MKKRNKNIFKNIYDYIVLLFKEEWKFLIFLVLTFILFTWPVNYYIIVGGGISDIDSRIKVEDAYKSKGSFNISYVTELDGRLITYLLSYVMPNWERESVDDYKYDTSESMDDISFRAAKDLESANSKALQYSFTLADRDIKTLSTNIYIVAKFSEYESKLKVQDELVGVNGNSFNSVLEYQNYLQNFNTGDEVLVNVIRKGKKQEIKSKIYDVSGRKILGVSLEVVNKYETDPNVKINFKSSESGPSGGLMTTLDIYNKLTKSDLTHGLNIAGTGTINEDGSVGTIGGVEYKLIGAVAGKADVFIVPSGENYDDCVKLKKEKNLKIKLIKAKTVNGVIDSLNKLK